MSKMIESEEQPRRELPPISDGDGHYQDVIVATEADLAAKEYMDELKFMQDELRVVIHRGREKKASPWVQIGVNGPMRWFRVEQEVAMPRSYVEVLARSQPMDIETKIEDEQSETPINKIIRSTRSQYPFTVMHDPSPKAAKWLAKVMRES